MNYAEIIAKLARDWRSIRKSLDLDRVLQQAIAIQQIPAPTFEEQERAHYVETLFYRLGLQQVHRDSLHNVIGWLGTPHEKPIIFVSAHLDTVFPHNTDLAVHYEDNRIYGPGLGDNSLGVAALLMLIEVFAQQSLFDHVAICFVANVCEEGLGNLDGMRAVLNNLSPLQISAAIVIEGMALGRVYHAGIAVHRWKITATAEGGHSWLNFGRVSAIHGLVRFGADVTQIQVPETPRTTYNIGLIEGGQSVNSIANQAQLYLDLRSTNWEALAKLEQQVHDLITQHTSDELRLVVEVVGDRPAGDIAPEHPLVQLALAALAEVGISGVLEHGSTDANILLANNVPTVVVGITHGGNAHRLDEFIETPPLLNGLWQLILLVGAVIEWNRP